MQLASGSMKWSSTPDKVGLALSKGVQPPPQPHAAALVNLTPLPDLQVPMCVITLIDKEKLLTAGEAGFPPVSMDRNITMCRWEEPICCGQLHRSPPSRSSPWKAAA